MNLMSVQIVKKITTYLANTGKITYKKIITKFGHAFNFYIIIFNCNLLVIKYYSLCRY